MNRKLFSFSLKLSQFSLGRELFRCRLQVHSSLIISRMNLFQSHSDLITRFNAIFPANYKEVKHYAMSYLLVFQIAFIIF